MISIMFLVILFSKWQDFLPLCIKIETILSKSLLSETSHNLPKVPNLQKEVFVNYPSNINAVNGTEWQVRADQACFQWAKS